MTGNRAEYVGSLRPQLDQWRVHLHEVGENATHRGRSAEEQYVQRVRAVERQMREAEEKLAQLQAAGNESWDRLRNETARVFTQLNRLYADAVSRLV